MTDLDHHAVIVSDVRDGFALVSVEVSLTESAQRALTAAFIDAADGSSWVRFVFGLPPMLRVEPPPDTSVAPTARPYYVSSIAATVVEKVEGALRRRRFAVRVVTKGAA